MVTEPLRRPEVDAFFPEGRRVVVRLPDRLPPDFDVLRLPVVLFPEVVVRPAMCHTVVGGTIRHTNHTASGVI
ncbi:MULTISPECIES: hypothetical protein [Actinoalloteichus]|uniref:hypothetical protein n=1 Tax=Actinoalloteichus TaxID=65496 RepID=UPI001E394012|nr:MULTISPECIES: hypothetical protein [Actinoalloteichus]